MEINASAQDLLAQIRDYQNKIEAVKNGGEISPAIGNAQNQETDISAGPTFSSQLSKAFTSAISEVNELQNLSTSSIDRDFGALWELLVALLTASLRSRGLKSSKIWSSELSGSYLSVI